MYLQKFLDQNQSVLQVTVVTKWHIFGPAGIQTQVGCQTMSHQTTRPGKFLLDTLSPMTVIFYMICNLWLKHVHTIIPKCGNFWNVLETFLVLWTWFVCYFLVAMDCTLRKHCQLHSQTPNSNSFEINVDILIYNNLQTFISSLSYLTTIAIQIIFTLRLLADKYFTLRPILS